MTAPLRLRVRELMDDLRYAGGRRILGQAAVTVLVLASIVLVSAVVQQGRDAASDAARSADRYRPPSLPTVSPVRGDLALIGDETATLSSAGRLRGWSAATADRTGLRFTVLATPGAGYLAGTAASRTFVEQARDVPADVDYVVIVGGIHDLDRSALKLTQAATEAVAAAHARAPRARILMIGPLTFGSDNAESVRTLRRLLCSAAAIAEVTWLDPIAADWLLDPTDDGALTGAEARRVASRVTAALRPLPE